jgi:hypothetical protein
MDTQIGDWVAERNRHKEWNDYSTKDFVKNAENGAKSFYRQFETWRAKQTNDKRGQKTLTEQLFPPRFISYSHIITISDWVAERKKHKEWDGFTPKNFKEFLPAQSFYKAFYKWLNKPENIGYKKAYADAVLSCARKSYSHLVSFADWVCEKNAHKEWADFSTTDFQSGQDLYARQFYNAFYEWAHRIENIGKQEEYHKTLFPSKYCDYSHLVTIDDWVRERNNHGEWDSYTVTDFDNANNGKARSFYYTFRKWVGRPKNKIFLKAYTDAVFPPQYKNHSNLLTIGDWVLEKRSHEEWRNYAISDFRSDKKSGASSFYHAFVKWRKRPENREHSVAYTYTVFPPKKGTSLFSFGNELVKFDSASERAIAILLNKYGLANSFREDLNLHVRVNGQRRHSIDFLINGTFLEYHPLSILDIRDSLTVQQSGERKRQSITNPDYTGLPFVHIWKVEQLFEKFLMLPQIKSKLPPYYEALTFEQFRQHVSEARKQAIEYDIKTGAIESPIGRSMPTR